MLRSWTNLALPDPFAEQAAGRAWFSIDGLLALRALVDISMKAAATERGDV